MADPKELISTGNYLKQLRIELEHELLAETDIRRSRALRRAVRGALDEAISDRLKPNLGSEVEAVLEQARRNIQPVIKELKARRKPKEAERYFERINLSVRLQHGMMAVAVILLIITGLPLKFPDVPLFVWMIGMLGGINFSTFLHRVGAVVLIAVSLWHAVYIVFFREGRRDFRLMLPRVKDIRDFIQMMKFYLGLAKEKPRFGRFNYIEKFDYWAVYWGCVIMIGTGVLLWSPEFTFSYFPKYVYDIAKEVHSDEALLATLAIVIWHFYNVHFNPSVFPGSLLWFNGRISESKMREEHPLEYEEIMQRQAGGKAAGDKKEAG